MSTFSDNTVARIFTNESFASKDSRVGAAVVTASAEYLRIFTCEAIALAIHSKEQSSGGAEAVADSRDIDKVKEDLVSSF